MSNTITYISLTCNHYLKTRGEWVNRTWRRCIDKDDKFYFLSSTPDPFAGVIGYNDPDDYQGAPLKLMSLFKYEKFNTDWIYICDDDTFVFPDRLKKILVQYDSKVKQCICRKGICPNNPNIFNISFPVTFPDGGAGFAITQSLYTSIQNYLNSTVQPLFSLNGDVTFGVWAREVGFSSFIDRTDVLKHCPLSDPDSKDVTIDKVVTTHYCKEAHFTELFHVLEQESQNIAPYIA